jgi:hypothetical protein
MESDIRQLPAPPVGVIESLSRGFETVAGRLGLALLPVLLDLLLWVGPRISLRPAIMAYYQEIWQPTINSFESDVQVAFADFTSMILDAAENMPPLYLPLLGAPSLMAWNEAEPLPFDYLPVVWQIATPWGVVAANLAALAAGFLLSTIYMTVIAEAVRAGNEKLNWRLMMIRLPRNILWLGILAAVLPVVLLVIYMPFAVLGGSIAMFSSVVGLLIDWAGRLLVLWITLFLLFSIHGILLNNRGPLGALWDSLRVVQWNLSSTIMLILLVVVLNIALTYVWDLAPMGSWLAPVAIAGNAFITTGLVTATFVYFKDRYRYWRESRAMLLAEIERRKVQQRRG